MCSVHSLKHGNVGQQPASTPFPQGLFATVCHGCAYGSVYAWRAGLLKGASSVRGTVIVSNEQISGAELCLRGAQQSPLHCWDEMGSAAGVIPLSGGTSVVQARSFVWAR